MLMDVVHAVFILLYFSAPIFVLRTFDGNVMNALNKPCNVMSNLHLHVHHIHAVYMYK